MSSKQSSIQRRALRIEQNAKSPLYVFTLTGEEILQIADISRISRSEAGDLIGYQRPEVNRHIKNITEYLNQDDIIFPNSIILAMSSKVKFRQSRGPATGDGLAVSGLLEIPLPKEGQVKPAWIVDGQQRTLALAKSNRKDFPIPVNAFVADDLDLQRDQFLRVNSSKPLPPGLITELLPEVNTTLPPNLAAKRIPSYICDWLNQNDASPLKGMIKRASTPKPSGSTAVIQDTTIVKMIQESLTSASGCLFPYRDIVSGETDFESISRILVTYWSAVSIVFPEAWGLPPKSSRLMHGAGLRAMGRLMDVIMPTIRCNSDNAIERTVTELEKIESICKWTSGRWIELDGIKWNDIQNVPRHINLLSSVIIRAYTLSREVDQ